MSSRVLPEFELFIPTTIFEALSFLNLHNEEVTIMAGGTDVMVEMKHGVSNRYVLSLCKLQDLNYIKYDEASGLRIGAMTTISQIVSSEIVKEKYRGLWQAASKNGSVQTRSVATVMGNILRASPAGDCSCAILAHGGAVVLESTKGKRDVDIDEFWINYRVTNRRSNELAMELKLSNSAKGTISAFSTLKRTNEDLSKINTSVSITLENKICKKVRIAMGAVAPTPLRLKKSENILLNREITEDLLDKMSNTVKDEIAPIDDVRSSMEYRRDVAGVLLKRTIKDSLK